MATRRLVLLGLAATATVVASLLFPSTIRAQQAGDVVVFMVPAGSGIMPGPDGDMAVFIGRPMGGVDASGGGCVTDSNLRPLQTVVFVDPRGGNRATRNNAVITLFVDGFPQTTAVPNGTRIANLILMSACSIGGESQDRFSGIVE